MADMDDGSPDWLRRELDGLSSSLDANSRVARCAHAYALELQLVRDWLRLFVLDAQQHGAPEQAVEPFMNVAAWINEIFTKFPLPKDGE